MGTRSPLGRPTRAKGGLRGPRFDPVTSIVVACEKPVSEAPRTHVAFIPAAAARRIVAVVGSPEPGEDTRQTGRCLLDELGHRTLLRSLILTDRCYDLLPSREVTGVTECRLSVTGRSKEILTTTRQSNGKSESNCP